MASTRGFPKVQPLPAIPGEVVVHERVAVAALLLVFPVEEVVVQEHHRRPRKLRVPGQPAGFCNIPKSWRYLCLVLVHRVDTEGRVEFGEGGMMYKYIFYLIHVSVMIKTTA